MRNRKIAIDKQKIISIVMILTVISIFISYNVFFRNNEVYALGQAKDVKTATEYKEAKDSVRMAIQEALLASDKGMLERDIFEKYLDKHINGAYKITNFSQYDDSGRGQYTVVVYKDQEKKKKIDTFGIDTSGNFTN